MIGDPGDFYSTKIHGRSFVGTFIAGRPAVVLHPEVGSMRWAALGASRLYPFAKDGSLAPQDPKSVWWACGPTPKHKAISLEGFSIQEVDELGRTFGIPVYDRSVTDFFRTPAWEGLRDWTSANPEAAAAALDDLLPGWRVRAERETAELALERPEAPAPGQAP